jgi:hypothetical protein
MIVVSDASPLLSLAQADHLHLLKALFGTVLIPEAVRCEVVDQCRIVDQRRRITAAISDPISVQETPTLRTFSRNLGRGEQGVIALALERSADLLLLDDRKARNEAREHGLACAFTTDVLRLAERRAIIPSAMEVIAGLRAHRIFLPEIPHRTDGSS